ncbi:MORC family CW-type zinc finger protein 3a isoform X2 [Stegostoma tigrinum]|uniref:MORC family CW-type zinc finger protein 3a isoform X2 n=1 Tax=Stegostoma tigrinum TaxID=3053191 RepID=UPI0028706828|nr:MORC family CW-type zinc finger protein 3a isoform X2 [Stegostoma tigrinum]
MASASLRSGTGGSGGRPLPLGPQDIPLSAMSPKFLHTNSTSHTWPFSALAELIDNAYDPDVNAKQMWIDKTEIKEKICLIFADNGQGMNQSKLHKMLSFGFSDKVAVNGHAPVGLYGNGFKSGSMRLGKDATVFTKNGETCSVGFLSQTYLEAIKAENVIVPIVSFNMNKKLLSEDMQSSLKAILQYSLFNTEKELLAELDAISGKRGTRIIIWNIRTTKDGKPEFDFESDKHDIRIPEDHLDDDAGKRKYKRQERMDQIVPESDYSLRAYCSILYLKPRMQIILLGVKVKTQLISKSLAHIEHDIYKPMFINKNIKITFGFNWRNKEHFGIMMYHKNRLIKSYEKVGCQLRANNMGVGVIGIIECNFLKPTHNKQDFDYTNEYRLTIQALGLKLNDYWNEKKNKRNQEDPQSVVPVEESQKLPDQVWAQCDGCLKWRKLQDGIDPDMLPDKWFCSMNPDPSFRSCSVPEEPEDAIDVTPSYEKTYKKLEQRNREKNRRRLIDQDKQKYLEEQLKLKEQELQEERRKQQQNMDLRNIIQKYNKEADALRKEQELLQQNLQAKNLKAMLPRQINHHETTEVTSSAQNLTKWVVNGDNTLNISPSPATATITSPVSKLQIVEVKSLSTPQIPSNGQSAKRTCNYQSASPNPKQPKLDEGITFASSVNGETVNDTTFDDDVIIVDEKSTPRPSLTFDLSKVKHEHRASTDTTDFCNDVLLGNCDERVKATQTENSAISVKEEGNGSEKQNLSSGTSDLKEQVQQSRDDELQCLANNEGSIAQTSEEQNIQNVVLKAMTDERDHYKAKCEQIEKELENVQKKLLEKSECHVKKECCHQWTQSEFIIGDHAETMDDFCKLSNEEKASQYELALKEMEKLKRQCQTLENLKFECFTCNLKENDNLVKKEEDELILQLDSMFRQLDSCKSERDQYKEEAERLQSENDTIKLNLANLCKEVERLKREATEAQQSNLPDGMSVKLRSLRIGIAQLLANIVPELDLAQINYESEVVDEILEQVLSANES